VPASNNQNNQAIEIFSYTFSSPLKNRFSPVWSVLRKLSVPNIVLKKLEALKPVYFGVLRPLFRDRQGERNGCTNPGLPNSTLPDKRDIECSRTPGIFVAVALAPVFCFYALFYVQPLSSNRNLPFQLRHGQLDSGISSAAAREVVYDKLVQ
jgi:hypothetical protein